MIQLHQTGIYKITSLNASKQGFPGKLKLDRIILYKEEE